MTSNEIITELEKFKPLGLRCNFTNRQKLEYHSLIVLKYVALERERPADAAFWHIAAEHHKQMVDRYTRIMKC